VKHARRLATRAFRASEGEFLAEGPQAVREALNVAGETVEVFAGVDASDQHADLRGIADVAGVPWHVVTDDVIVAITDTVQPQGLVARCKAVDVTLDALLAGRPEFVVVCADIRDPGNAGAVIRCADAAGASGVVFVGDSVDPFNPKSVRATVGSVFHLPIVIDKDIAATLSRLQTAGLQVLAADGGGDVDLYGTGLDLRAPTAWLMGNEAWGLPEQIRGLADRVVAVPIYGHAESLNLATAAAVCLYATAQARNT
jgi:TrmH family RNA methyltransferase